MTAQIIAEAGVNYGDDLAAGWELIDVAPRAGAEIVKFQTFNADELASPDPNGAAGA